MSVAEIDAVNWVDETYVVVRSAPFHRTTEPFINPLPLTVNVNPDSPAAAYAGDILLRTGTGLVEPPSKLTRVKLSYV
jgi:hypothetical protein